jgi:hypothetical protein
MSSASLRVVSTRLAKHARGLRDVVMADIINQDHSRDIIASFHRDKGVLCFVHCVCHRRALVLTDAIKGLKGWSKTCDGVIPDVCITLINNLYNYFAKKCT